MPTAGRGRRHLSLARPATAVALGPSGVSGGEAVAPTQGSGVGAGRSPPPPSPAPSVGAAALPEERPSRALCPAAPASGARRLKPSPLLPSARSSAAEPRLSPQGCRSRPPRAGPALRVLTKPPGRRLGPPLPPPPPPPLPRLPGRPHWALGLDWVKGRGRARARRGSRGAPRAGRH